LARLFAMLSRFICWAVIPLAAVYIDRNIEASYTRGKSVAAM
jgi:hypothetical protein